MESIFVRGKLGTALGRSKRANYGPVRYVDFILGATNLSIQYCDKKERYQFKYSLVLGTLPCEMLLSRGRGLIFLLLLVPLSGQKTAEQLLDFREQHDDSGSEHPILVGTLDGDQRSPRDHAWPLLHAETRRFAARV